MDSLENSFASSTPSSMLCYFESEKGVEGGLSYCFCPIKNDPFKIKQLVNALAKSDVNYFFLNLQKIIFVRNKLRKN